MDYAIEQFALGFEQVGWAVALLRGEPAPATYTIGSDSYPMTVIGVIGVAGSVLLAVDDRVVGRGLFIAGGDAVGEEPERFTRRPDGRYRRQGSKYGTLIVGRRELYLDPSF